MEQMFVSVSAVRRGSTWWFRSVCDNKQVSDISGDYYERKFDGLLDPERNSRMGQKLTELKMFGSGQVAVGGLDVRRLLSLCTCVPDCCRCMDRP